MMASLLDDTEHCRRRAKEARDLAAEMNDPVARRSMLALAETYDGLVTRAEARIMRVGGLT